MADKKQIKDIINKLHANPKQLDDLLAGDRSKKLKTHGADKLTRKEVQAVMEELLTTPDAAGSPARIVEWVGAIAAAAAGAMAA
jgi:hypothetical protein